MEGTLTAEQAEDLFAANALAKNMQATLNPGQQEQLAEYDLLLKQDTLVEVYKQALLRTGDAISGASQEQIVNVLVDEILSIENNYAALVNNQGSMRDAHNDKIAAFHRARETLLPQLDSAQIEHLDRFINAQTSGVDIILEASTDGEGRVSITQARIGMENLPQ